MEQRGLRPAAPWDVVLQAEGYPLCYYAGPSYFKYFEFQDTLLSQFSSYFLSPLVVPFYIPDLKCFVVPGVCPLKFSLYTLVPLVSS